MAIWTNGPSHTSSGADGKPWARSNILVWYVGLRCLWFGIHSLCPTTSWLFLPSCIPHATIYNSRWSSPSSAFQKLMFVTSWRQVGGGERYFKKQNKKTLKQKLRCRPPVPVEKYLIQLFFLNVYWNSLNIVFFPPLLIVTPPNFLNNWPHIRRGKLYVIFTHIGLTDGKFKADI